MAVNFNSVDDEARRIAAMRRAEQTEEQRRAELQKLIEPPPKVEHFGYQQFYFTLKEQSREIEKRIQYLECKREDLERQLHEISPLRAWLFQRLEANEELADRVKTNMNQGKVE